MKTIIYVKGTDCPSCKVVIEEICKEIPGVTSCKVDFKTGKTEIEHDSTFNKQIFKKEVESIGKYKVVLDAK